MTESHESCRDLYECSSTELDDLTKICLEKGAVGSRLTGAGWGGCAVSLVHSKDVKDFIEGVKKDYYQAKRSDAIANLQMDELLFASEPGRGALIMKNVSYRF